MDNDRRETRLSKDPRNLKKAFPQGENNLDNSWKKYRKQAARGGRMAALVTYSTMVLFVG